MKRIGADWVSWVDVQVNNLQKRVAAAKVLKGDDLFLETFIAGTEASARADAMYNLGAFASHVSYLVAEASRAKHFELYE